MVPTLSSDTEELVSKGEYKLLQGYFAQAKKAFSAAEKMLQDSQAPLYFRMGLAFFEYGSEEGNEDVLLQANKKFKKAHLIDRAHSETLHAWGNSLTHLGERKEEHHYFVSALEKYEKALSLGLDTADLYWDLGIVWYHIGNHSGEAVDYQKALQAYENAAEKGEELPAEFWIDYGATALMLTTKLHDMRQVVRAINCFKHAVSIDNANFESWSFLAEALEILYDHTHDEDHFSQANECYVKAAHLAPQEGEIWLCWAKLLLRSASGTSDIKRLRSSLEKCHHAYACDSINGQILAVWAEALALLGQFTERLDLIYEAENKIAEALELDEEDPEIWYSLGKCFQCFGSYFQDHDYYYQAIEKFQTGLSLDRCCDHLWHALANSYATVGGIEEDYDTALQSFKFYEKAIAIKATSTLHVDYAKALAKLGEMVQGQKWLEQALYHFETAFAIQKNAVYLHPSWLFSYASTLDMLGDFHEEQKYYTRSIEIFSHVLMVDPDFPHVHHRLAQVFCHLGELCGETDHFYRAIHHLRLARARDEDNDAIILDWGIALISIAQHTPVITDTDQLMHDAKQKITLAAKLGNVQAYYYLSCLYSLLNDQDTAMHFLLKADHFDALPSSEELFTDEWLDGLRSTSAFHEFLSEHPHLQEER